jgi:hypothetical protein
MKSILLTQISGASSSLIIVLSFFFLALTLSALLLWLKKTAKMPGWLVSCFITSFFLLSAIPGIVLMSNPPTRSMPLAELLPILVLLLPLFLVTSTFTVPISIPVGLAIYFAGRKFHRAEQMTVVGCAATEHVGGETTFAGAFGAKKKLPAYQLLTGGTILSVALTSFIRLPAGLDGPFEVVKPWAIFWVTQTQPTMDGMSNTARHWTNELNRFATSK